MLLVALLVGCATPDCGEEPGSSLGSAERPAPLPEMHDTASVAVESRPPTGDALPEFTGRRTGEPPSAFVPCSTEAPFIECVYRGPRRIAHGDLPVLALGAQEGMTVADVGCGRGAHLERIVARIEPGGRLLCRDIHKDAIDHVLSKIDDREIQIADARVSVRHDPRLPDASVDLILLSDVIHLVLTQQYTRVDFVEQLKWALVPGGVAVVTYYSANLKRRDMDALLETSRVFQAAGFETGRRWQVEIPGRRKPFFVFEFRRPLENR